MEAENPIIEAIKTRRSIRQFTKEPVSDELLDRILESGLWAPSGKNNQPWKFAVIRDLRLRRSLASLTHYGSVIRNTPICIMRIPYDPPQGMGLEDVTVWRRWSF